MDELTAWMRALRAELDSITEETPEHLWQYAVLLGYPALRQEMLGF